MDVFWVETVVRLINTSQRGDSECGANGGNRDVNRVIACALLPNIEEKTKMLSDVMSSVD